MQITSSQSKWRLNTSRLKLQTEASRIEVNHYNKMG